MKPEQRPTRPTPAGSVVWVEAAANYVVLHTAAGNQVLRRNLSALEAELDPRQFFRLGRSALVNLALIREIETVSAGEHTVVLHNGVRLTLTRGLRELQERLKSAL